MKTVYVTENIIRGPRLSGEELLNLHVASVLNLENDDEAVKSEMELCHTNGIEFINLPLSEIMPPSPDQLRQCVSMIFSLKRSLYIHCLHGQDRTGFVIAAYKMIIQHWPLDKAYQECLDYGHHVFWYWWWKQSLIKLSKEINKY